MDSRLRWQQLVVPDLNGASAAVARAGQSFNRGLETASGVLERYNTGQQEQADAALLSDLASLRDEAEFDAFVDGGGLEGRNISSTMRDQVLGARTGFVQDAGVRANTQGTLARTAIAQAAEGRNVTNFQYKDGRRRELADLSGLIVGANQEGNQFGRGQSGGIPDSYYSAVIGSESSGDPNARNPNSTATGLAQFTTGTWNQMMQNYPELGLTADGRTDPDQAQRALRAFTQENAASLQGAGIPVNGGNLYAAHFLGAGGARSVLTQPDNTQLTDILPNEVITANPFLRGMSVGRFREWSAEKGGSGNAPSTPQFDRLQAALGNSQFLNPNDISSLIAGGYDVQGIGQGRLDAAAAAREQAAADAAVLGAFSDPTVSGDPASQLAAAEAAGLDAGGTLDLFGRIQGAAGANPSIFNPQAPEDPLIAAATAAQTAENERRDLITQRQQTDIASINENPIDALKTITGLNDSNVGNGSFSDRDILSRVDEIADKHNITRGEAVYAMTQAFVQDPGQRIPGWDLTRNNLTNHFPDEAVDRIVADRLGPDARARAQDASAITTRDSANAESSLLRLRNLQSQALRYQAAGQPVPEEIAREVTQTENTLRAGSTPQGVQQELQTYIVRTGTASRLEGLDPESPEFFRAISDLETQIQSDRSLGADEKRLLLSALRG